MSKLQTIDIKGKEYVLVNERIRAFRENYKGYRLTSEIISNENGVCLIKAEVLDENGNVVATGHAYEKEGSTYINKTSYIENCETSAWGRALGNLGIGIDTSIASYEEVANAVANQNKKPTKEGKKEVDDALNNFNEMFGSDPLLTMIHDLLAELESSEETVLGYYKKEKLVDLTEAEKKEAIKILKAKKIKQGA